jgi:hypothetical protein
MKVHKAGADRIVRNDVSLDSARFVLPLRRGGVVVHVHEVAAVARPPRRQVRVVLGGLVAQLQRVVAGAIASHVHGMVNVDESIVGDHVINPAINEDAEHTVVEGIALRVVAASEAHHLGCCGSKVVCEAATVD